MAETHIPFQLLPYPDGKTFAFTIVDDTDMATLESVRPVYETLFELGLRTTKTVWASEPDQPPASPVDTGDSLARHEYADYMVQLRARGFEIALHNVASRSSKRERIEGGLRQYRQRLGEDPRMNVHHQKNRENLYFDFAQVGPARPLFQTNVFQGLYKSLRRRDSSTRPLPHRCCGEDEQSEYFWGDICLGTFTYLRTNVFYRDLNTLKCNPAMPYQSAETPYVNYWFDSSNGQDVDTCNALLSDENVARFKAERGCAILYTHFGMGFVKDPEGRATLNAETRRGLAAVAGDSDGWYVPAGSILDRLAALQQLRLIPLPDGAIILNRGEADVQGLTIEATRGETYSDAITGEVFQADGRSSIVLPRVGGRDCVILIRDADALRHWNEPNCTPLEADLRTVLNKVRRR